MRLLLIRHGETVDNVAQVFAGTTDSVLTSHGLLQAERLGQWINTSFPPITHAFCSNLKRAYTTAGEVVKAQSQSSEQNIQPERLAELREQHFGVLEGASFRRKGEEPVMQWQEAEGVESLSDLTGRLDKFLNERIWPLLREESMETQQSQNENIKMVVVVSHGITLGILWKCIIRRVDPHKLYSREVNIPFEQHGSMNRLGGWSNTGYLYLDLNLAEPAAASSNEKLGELPIEEKSNEWDRSKDRAEIHINAINSVEHLKNLKRTKGGIGSSAADERQSKLDSFFVKKPKARDN